MTEARAYAEAFARPAGQNLLFLCDWLPPDFGAVGQYTVIRARELAIAGHKVTVYGFSSGPRPEQVDVCGSGSLRVVYLQRPPYNKQRLLSRAWWTLGANWRLLRACKADYARADEVIFSGSPPYMLHFIALFNLWRRRTLVYRISDFHPECLMAEYGRVPLWLRAVHRLTLFWRRRIQQFEVLGLDQAARLAEAGIPSTRVRLLRDPSPVQFSAAELPATRPATLAGRRILLYSGNFGVAHDHQTLCEALELVEARYPGAVGLWLNAVGKKADMVESQLRDRGLAVQRSQPVELSALAGLLRSPDAHLICLRDAFVGYVLPSKVYACIASGLPILYIGSAGSDVHLLCSAAPQPYAQVNCGDSAAAAAAIATLLGLDRAD